MRKINKTAAAKPALHNVSKASLRKIAADAVAAKQIAAATKPTGKAAKPVTAAATAPKPNAAFAVNRGVVKAFYNGLSLTVHNSKPGKLQRYIDRVKAPAQCADSPSVRDESLLALIHANNKAGAFDPVTLGADLGVISRLASLGFITVRGDGLALTSTGAERASVAAKRKA